MTKILSIIFLILFFVNAFCYEILRPEKKQKYIETEHFNIFSEKDFSQIQFIADIAEAGYQDMKNVFGIELSGKTPIIIKGYDELSFGDADPFRDRIVIHTFFNISSSSSMVHPYRELIRHELAHIFTFKFLSSKNNLFRRTITLGFFPLWLIEGIAQFASEDWSAQNEAHMRSVSLDRSFLSLSDLNSFYYLDGETRHRGYTESFALTKFIMEKIIPSGSVKDLLTCFSRDPLHPDNMLNTLCGKTLYSVYSEYCNYYMEKNKTLLPQSRHETLSFPGKYMRNPRFVSQGKQLAFIGDESNDSETEYNLYLMNLKTEKYHLVEKSVDPYYDFSSDGKYCVYSHLYFSQNSRRYLYDVFLKNIESGEKKRITQDFSARFPCFSDSSEIVFTRFGTDGNSLYRFNLLSGELKKITDEKEGFFFYGLKNYKGSITASVFDGNHRQICRITDKGITPLTMFEGDCRNPAENGSGLFFLSSGNNMKYQLYYMQHTAEGEKEGAETRFSRPVLFETGVFDRDILEFDLYENLLVYAVYENNSFRIRLCDQNTLNKTEVFQKTIQKESAPVLFSEKHHVYNYQKKLSLTASTPWIEYENGFLLGALVTAGDFLEFNSFLAKLNYNLETERLGQKITFTSRSFPFSVTASYENTAYESRYGNSVYHKRNEILNMEFGYPLNPKEVFYWGAENRKVSPVLLDPPVFPPPFQGKINQIYAGYKFFRLHPSPDWDINPRDGRFLKLEARKASDIFNSDVSYNEYRFYWDEYLKLKHDSQTFFIRMAHGRKEKISSLNSPILYGIGGNETVRGFSADSRFGSRFFISSLEYRFLVRWNLIRPRIGWFYMNKMFGALFYDTGNAWLNDASFRDSISSSGLELKIKSLILGKVPVITRTGAAFRLRGNTGVRFYISFDLPMF